MTEIVLAVAELEALAAAMRPDWNRDIMSGAIRAAQDARWPPGRILAEVARLICDPVGDPRNLSRAARPQAREKGVTQDRSEKWAEAIRSTLPEPGTVTRRELPEVAHEHRMRDGRPEIRW